MTQQQNRRHVMLSYEWQIQKLVLSTYNYLAQKEIPIWMDIKAGITSANLYEGISEAIENSICFVCFMTPEYQQSDFCKQEFLYAKQCNILIIPLKVVGNWTPTSWLGFITVGLLWLDFYHLKNFENKAIQLYKRICSIAGNQFQLKNPYETKSKEIETALFRERPPCPLPTYSSPRQNTTYKQNDLGFRNSSRDLANQSSSQTSNTYQMKTNPRNKSAISQSQASFRMGKPPSSALISAYLDPNNHIFQKKSKKISTVAPQNRYIRQRSPTTKIPHTNYYMRQTRKSSSDDDEEEEKNASKSRY